MKRDMDLVRQIMQTLEARPSTSNVLDLEIAGRHRLEVWQHLEIMAEARLVKGVSLTSSSVGCAGLTWEGHEFLEAARNDTIWQKAKDVALKATGGLSLDALKTTLSVLCTKAIAAATENI